MVNFEFVNDVDNTYSFKIRNYSTGFVRLRGNKKDITLSIKG